MYDGFDVSKEIEPQAWREVLRIINEASVEGLIDSGHETHEQAFLRELRHSNEVFFCLQMSFDGHSNAEAPF